MRNGLGMNGGEWVVMLAVWGGLLGVIVFVIARVVSGDRGGRWPEGAPATHTPTPREILDARLARGEIDAEAHRAVADRLAHGTGR